MMVLPGIDPTESGQIEDRYFGRISSDIIDSAQKSVGKGKSPTALDYVIAFETYLGNKALGRTPKGNWVQDNLFLWVVALMTIVFGLLAFFWTGDNQKGFLDIAKIFAGAVVGSAAGSLRRNARGS